MDKKEHPEVKFGKTGVLIINLGIKKWRKKTNSR